MTFDRHLTFGEHINLMTEKFNGIIGMLARAAPRLPRELYSVRRTVIRIRLELASAALIHLSLKESF